MKRARAQYFSGSQRPRSHVFRPQKRTLVHQTKTPWLGAPTLQTKHVLSNLPGDYEHFPTFRARHTPAVAAEIPAVAVTPAAPTAPAGAGFGAFAAAAAAVGAAAVGVAAVGAAAVGAAANLAISSSSKVVAAPSAPTTKAMVTGEFEVLRLAVPDVYTQLYCDTLLLQLEAYLLQRSSGRVKPDPAQLYRLEKLREKTRVLAGILGLDKKHAFDNLRKILYKYILTDDDMTKSELTTLACFRENILVDSGFYTSHFLYTNRRYANNDQENFRNFREEGRFALLIGILPIGTTLDTKIKVPQKPSKTTQDVVTKTTQDVVTHWFQVAIEADGDCMYGAIATCLNNNVPQKIYPQFDAKTVKKKILDNVEKLGNAYIELITKEYPNDNYTRVTTKYNFWSLLFNDTDNYKYYTSEQIEQDEDKGIGFILEKALRLYLEKKRVPKPEELGYGANLEIDAAARLYGDIVVQTVGLKGTLISEVTAGVGKKLIEERKGSRKNAKADIPDGFIEYTRDEYDKHVTKTLIEDDWSGIYIQCRGIHYTSFIINPYDPEVRPEAWTQWKLDNAKNEQ